MAEQKANLFTKYGMIRMLLLRRHSKENLQCQTDLDNLINEFEVSDPIERERVYWCLSRNRLHICSQYSSEKRGT